jgi:hypothetical protein
MTRTRPSARGSIVSEGRASYVKTTAAAGIVTAGGLAVVAALLVLGVSRSGNWAPTVGMAWAAGTLLALGATAWAGLATAGGAVALRRDGLEEEGLPYASMARRESIVGPVRGWLIRVLRRREARGARPRPHLGLRPGEWVEIRSLAEIMDTLDDQGTLDGVPFMPEMVPYCGRRVQVFRRVEKLNDWIHSAGLRRMHDLVLLEDLRCAGTAHGGCQANCHLRWREAWLRRSTPRGAPPDMPDARAVVTASASLAALCVRDEAPGDRRYVCQATQLAADAPPLSSSAPRYYLREFLCGNVRLRPFLLGAAIACFNAVQRARGGVGFPAYVPGAAGSPPQESLNLQPGERVRVKPKHTIEPTLNASSKNRGLYFDRDMLRFCGGEYTVKLRLECVIAEKTGKLIQLTNPCIVLDGVTATGEYNGFNPENEHIFWREIWLERAAAVPPASGGAA